MAQKCAICGAEINVFQSQKLADGNFICRKNCRKIGMKVFDYVHADLPTVLAHNKQVEEGTRIFNELFLPRKKAKDKTNPFVLSGFGHRVYKTLDPRARIAKKMNLELLSSSHHEDKMLEVALKLEEKALSDDYFIERHLYPNIDFYTGIMFHMMGFPQQMFTVLFAMGRTPGWIAHWLEWRHDIYQKLGRPRQVYVGPLGRKVIPINERL